MEQKPWPFEGPAPVWFADMQHATHLLTDDQANRLYSAVFDYYKTGEEKELESPESILYCYVTTMIDRDRSLIKKPPKGENHWNWKGGITPKNQRERSSGEYAAWRKDVFTRDNYTCQHCGQRGGSLNAHHIQPWAKYPDKRYAVENGITLCAACHKAEHKRR